MVHFHIFTYALILPTGSSRKVFIARTVKAIKVTVVLVTGHVCWTLLHVSHARWEPTGCVAYMYTHRTHVHARPKTTLWQAASGCHHFYTILPNVALHAAMESAKFRPDDEPAWAWTCSRFTCKHLQPNTGLPSEGLLYYARLSLAYLDKSALVSGAQLGTGPFRNFS